MFVGMHGLKGDLDSVLDDLNSKENGGVLNNFEVVEYVDGLAPGVFIIVKGKNVGVANELNYLLKKGDRDHHILYRPFHLASLETPLTIDLDLLLHFLKSSQSEYVFFLQFLHAFPSTLLHNNHQYHQCFRRLLYLS